MKPEEALDTLQKFKDSRSNQNSNLCDALQVAIEAITFFIQQKKISK